MGRARRGGAPPAPRQGRGAGPRARSMIHDCRRTVGAGAAAARGRPAPSFRKRRAGGGGGPWRPAGCGPVITSKRLKGSNNSVAETPRRRPGRRGRAARGGGRARPRLPHGRAGTAVAMPPKETRARGVSGAAAEQRVLSGPGGRRGADRSKGGGETGVLCPRMFPPGSNAAPQAQSMLANPIAAGSSQEAVAAGRKRRPRSARAGKGAARPARKGGAAPGGRCGPHCRGGCMCTAGIGQSMGRRPDAGRAV